VVERDRRAVAASFFLEAELASGITLALPEAAAHHARVKRMNVGDGVRLTDGKGLAAFGAITSLDKKAVHVDVSHVQQVAQPRPIQLCVPIGDRDRMLWLAEKATELGATTWQPVRFRRSASVSPRGEGEAFAEKVRLRMINALEQSGGAWLPRILPDVALDALSVNGAQQPILLDPSGAPLPRLLRPNREPVILFGPEGGIEADERARLAEAGWQTASLADTVLRFETAGVAALAVCRAQLLEEKGNG
jgi:16S rRNA (uracil1498-N3)-methyltransferase